MRPTGTEPKIKIYYYAKSMDHKEEADEVVQEMKEAVEDLVEKIE